MAKSVAKVQVVLVGLWTVMRTAGCGVFELNAKSRSHDPGREVKTAAYLVHGAECRELVRCF